LRTIISRMERFEIFSTLAKTFSIIGGWPMQFLSLYLSQYVCVFAFISRSLFFKYCSFPPSNLKSHSLSLSLSHTHTDTHKYSLSLSLTVIFSLSFSFLFSKNSYFLLLSSSFVVSSAYLFTA